MQGANEGVSLYWGIAADGSVVISENWEVIKASCAKSYAQFPAGMSHFHIFISWGLFHGKER